MPSGRDRQALEFPPGLATVEAFAGIAGVSVFSGTYVHAMTVAGDMPVFKKQIGFSVSSLPPPPGKVGIPDTGVGLMGAACSPPGTTLPGGSG